MRKYATILPFCFFVSCVSLHTPSPHFVPSITTKNQLEAEAYVGLRSASVNLAYSPIRRITLLGSVQALPFKRDNHNYQRSCELGVGTYGSRRKSIYGINAGYGLGAYNWDYMQFNDSIGYSVLTNGDFKKCMVQVFFALTDDSSNPGWVSGLSFKGSLFWDQYASLRYSHKDGDGFSGLEKNSSFEPCVFTRIFFNTHFSLNLQAGMNISYDHSMFWPSQYVFLRFGLGLKL